MFASLTKEVQMKSREEQLTSRNHLAKGRQIKLGQSSIEKNLSVCEEIALELNVQGGLGKAFRKSQTCLQHALSYVDKQENF